MEISELKQWFTNNDLNLGSIEYYVSLGLTGKTESAYDGVEIGICDITRKYCSIVHCVCQAVNSSDHYDVQLCADIVVRLQNYSEDL